MDAKEIESGNRLIWNFMGGKWQPTENAGSSGMTSYDPWHDTFEECEKACAEINSLKSGSPRELVYAIPSPAKNRINRDLKYHTSWDWLMPVVEKIKDSYQGEELHQKSCELYDDIEAMLKEINIEWLWQSVVKFLTWLNQQSLSTDKQNKEI